MSSRLRPASTVPVASSGLTLKSIGQLSAETGIAHHILRYWESRFEQLRPVTRAGNRRYYRPEHVALVKRINALLHDEGYTINGVRHLLQMPEPAQPEPIPPGTVAIASLQMMLAIRNGLSAALAADDGRG